MADELGFCRDKEKAHTVESPAVEVFPSPSLEDEFDCSASIGEALL